MTIAEQITRYMEAAYYTSLQPRGMMPGPLQRFTVADIATGVGRTCGWTVSTRAIEAVLRADGRFVYEFGGPTAGGWRIAEPAVIS